MKNITGTATAKTAYGKAITPITYSFDYAAFETGDEVRAAGKFPTDAEVVKWRTDEALANSKSKALTAALDAAGYVKPTAENDDQVRLTTIFKGLMTAKLPNGEPRYTVEAAREMAETVTGCTWAD